MNCFILDEGGSCFKDVWDKIFFKNVVEHTPCKTTDVKVMLLFHLVPLELLNFKDEIFIRRGEDSNPNI